MTQNTTTKDYTELFTLAYKEASKGPAVRRGVRAGLSAAMKKHPKMVVAGSAMAGAGALKGGDSALRKVTEKGLLGVTSMAGTGIKGTLMFLLLGLPLVMGGVVGGMQSKFTEPYPNDFDAIETNALVDETKALTSRLSALPPRQNTPKPQDLSWR